MVRSQSSHKTKTLEFGTKTEMLKAKCRQQNVETKMSTSGHLGNSRKDICQLVTEESTHLKVSVSFNHNLK